MASTSRFEGLSVLRKDEKQGPTEAQLKMKEYLRKYTDGAGGDAQKKKKKKKKQGDAASAKVHVFDEDLSGFKAATRGFHEDVSDGEEGAFVATTVDGRAATEGPPPRRCPRRCEQGSSRDAAKAAGQGNHRCCVRCSTFRLTWTPPHP
jgi:hypothetical protein